MTQLSKLLYKTLHGSSLSIDQIAERLGLQNPWSLYKMADPTEPRYRFPLLWLVPLMKATANYGLLHHLARECGFVCYRYSRFRLGKKQDLGRLSELFGKAAAVIHNMYEHGEIDREGFDLIYGLLAEVAGHLRNAERIRSGQMEMSL